MGKSKFSPSMYVTVFELARSGQSNQEISRTIGVDTGTLKRWMRTNKHFKEAITRGRRGGTFANEQTFGDYVYQCLPPHLKEVWEELTYAEDEPDGHNRVYALLRDQGKVARQRLFVHALVHTMFNVSRACRMLAMGRRVFEEWCKEPTFAELIDEIFWHRDNFFEQALIGLVAGGDTAAILHVAKTKLRHRGYNPQTEVVATSTTGDTVDFGDLDLPVETQKEILAAMRAKRERAETQNVIEGHLAHG